MTTPGAGQYGEITSGVPGQLVDRLSGQVTGQVGDLAGDSTGLAPLLVADIVAASDEAAAASDEALRFVTDQVQQSSAEDVTSTGDVVIELDRSIADPLSNLVTRHDDFVTNTADQVQQFTIDTSQVGDLVANELSQTVNGSVAGELENIIDIVNALSPFPDIPGGEGQGLAEATGAVIGQALEPMVGAIVDPLTDVLKGFLGEFFEGALDDLEPLLDPLLRKLESNEELPQEIRDLLAPGFPALAPVMGAAMTFAVPLIVSNALGVLLTPPLQKVLAEESKLLPWQLLPLQTAAQAVWRGYMDRERYDDIRARLGFDPNDGQTMLDSQEALLNVSETTALWHREEITADQVDDQLHRLGFVPDDAERIKTLAFPIPGVSDLISMAVREVFSPEIAEAFGQFEEIPQPYLDWTAKQGLTEEWARNYWAAHWGLPSVFQGYEMLHRGIITDDDLDRLFVAQDIMPFWRDRLKAISYNPVTRVDLRRLYRDGVIDRDGLVRGYLDIGYNSRDAERLTVWTEQWAAAANAEEDPESRTLTKADVLKLFRNDVITRREAESYLTDMAFAAASIEALLNNIEIDQLLDDRKDDIDFVVGQAKAGTIDFEQAQSDLVALGLSDRERDKALSSVVRSKDRATRLPTKKELTGWLSSGLITEDRARAVFGDMGYAREWVDLYLSDTTGIDTGTTEEIDTEEIQSPV